MYILAAATKQRKATAHRKPHSRLCDVESERTSNLAKEAPAPKAQLSSLRLGERKERSGRGDVFVFQGSELVALGLDDRPYVLRPGLSSSHALHVPSPARRPRPAPGSSLVTLRRMLKSEPLEYSG